MNMKTTFCEDCRKDVSYFERDETITSELKGVKYTYHGKKAVSGDCSHEVFSHDVNDYNLKQLYDEFRRQHNIISLAKILEIPQKYNIGKRPLSLLLGWGEQTFSRYCDGDMPTQQYSGALQKIYDDPAYYLEILEDKKEAIKPLAYEKSKEATLKLLGNYPTSSTHKIDDVVDYLLCRCEDITPLALQKLLYYVQGFYYAFMDQFVFEENCEAWIHGPVFRKVYDQYKEYRFDPIQCSKAADFESITVYEKAVIDSVIKYLSCYSGKTLEAFTHAENPWLFTRGDLPATVAADRIIEKKLIGDYFKAVKENNKMLTPSDIGLYSDKMFHQIVM